MGSRYDSVVEEDGTENVAMSTEPTIINSNFVQRSIAKDHIYIDERKTPDANQQRTSDVTCGRHADNIPAALLGQLREAAHKVQARHREGVVRRRRGVVAW